MGGRGRWMQRPLASERYRSSQLGLTPGWQQWWRRKPHLSMHLFVSPKPALALKHKRDSLNTCMEAAETNSDVVEEPLAAGTRSHSHLEKAGQKPDSHLRSSDHILSVLQWVHLLCPSVCLWQDCWMVYLHPRHWTVDMLHNSLELWNRSRSSASNFDSDHSLGSNHGQTEECKCLSCSLQGYSLFRVRKETKASSFLGLYIFTMDQRKRQSNG